MFTISIHEGYALGTLTMACPSGSKVLAGHCNALEAPYKFSFNYPEGDDGWSCGGFSGMKYLQMFCSADFPIRMVGLGPFDDWGHVYCPPGYSHLLSGGCITRLAEVGYQASRPYCGGLDICQHDARISTLVESVNHMHWNAWECGGGGTSKSIFALCTNDVGAQLISRQYAFLHGDWKSTACPSSDFISVGVGCRTSADQFQGAQAGYSAEGYGLIDLSKRDRAACVGWGCATPWCWKEIHAICVNRATDAPAYGAVRVLYEINGDYVEQAEYDYWKGRLLQDSRSSSSEADEERTNEGTIHSAGRTSNVVRAALWREKYWAQQGRDEQDSASKSADATWGRRLLGGADSALSSVSNLLPGRKTDDEGTLGVYHRREGYVDPSSGLGAAASVQRGLSSEESADDKRMVISSSSTTSSIAASGLSVHQSSKRRLTAVAGFPPLSGYNTSHWRYNGFKVNCPINQCVYIRSAQPAWMSVDGMGNLFASNPGQDPNWDSDCWYLKMEGSMDNGSPSPAQAPDIFFLYHPMQGKYIGGTESTPNPMGHGLGGELYRIKYEEKDFAERLTARSKEDHGSGEPNIRHFHANSQWNFGGNGAEEMFYIMDRHGHAACYEPTDLSKTYTGFHCELGGPVRLRSSHGNFLAMSDQTDVEQMVQVVDSAMAYGEFHLIKCGSDAHCFRSVSHGTWLQAQPDGSWRWADGGDAATVGRRGAWERFVITPHPNDGGNRACVASKAHANKYYLQDDNDGDIAKRDGSGDGCYGWESWDILTSDLNNHACRWFTTTTTPPPMSGIPYHYYKNDETGQETECPLGTCVYIMSANNKWLSVDSSNNDPKMVDGDSQGSPTDDECWKFFQTGSYDSNNGGNYKATGATQYFVQHVATQRYLWGTDSNSVGTQSWAMPGEKWELHKDADGAGARERFIVVSKRDNNMSPYEMRDHVEVDDMQFGSGGVQERFWVRDRHGNMACHKTPDLSTVNSGFHCEIGATVRLKSNRGLFFEMNDAETDWGKGHRMNNMETQQGEFYIVNCGGGAVCLRQKKSMRWTKTRLSSGTRYWASTTPASIWHERGLGIGPEEERLNITSHPSVGGNFACVKSLYHGDPNDYYLSDDPKQGDWDYADTGVSSCGTNEAFEILDAYDSTQHRCRWFTPPTTTTEAPSTMPPRTTSTSSTTTGSTTTTSMPYHKMPGASAVCSYGRPLLTDSWCEDAIKYLGGGGVNVLGTSKLKVGYDGSLDPLHYTCPQPANWGGVPNGCVLYQQTASTWIPQYRTGSDNERMNNPADATWRGQRTFTTRLPKGNGCMRTDMELMCSAHDTIGDIAIGRQGAPLCAPGFEGVDLDQCKITNERLALQRGANVQDRSVALTGNDASTQTGTCKDAGWGRVPGGCNIGVFTQTDPSGTWIPQYRHLGYDSYMFDGGGEPLPDRQCTGDDIYPMCKALPWSKRLTIKICSDLGSAPSSAPFVLRDPLTRQRLWMDGANAMNSPGKFLVHEYPADGSTNLMLTTINTADGLCIEYVKLGTEYLTKVPFWLDDYCPSASDAAQRKGYAYLPCYVNSASVSSGGRVFKIPHKGATTTTTSTTYYVPRRMLFGEGEGTSAVLDLTTKGSGKSSDDHALEGVSSMVEGHRPDDGSLGPPSWPPGLEEDASLRLLAHGAHSEPYRSPPSMGFSVSAQPGTAGTAVLYLEVCTAANSASTGILTISRDNNAESTTFKGNTGNTDEWDDAYPFYWSWQMTAYPQSITFSHSSSDGLCIKEVRLDNQILAAAPFWMDNNSGTAIGCGGSYMQFPCYGNTRSWPREGTSAQLTVRTCTDAFASNGHTFDKFTVRVTLEDGSVYTDDTESGLDDSGQQWSAYWTFATSPGAPKTIELDLAGTDGLCIDDIRFDHFQVLNVPFWMDNPCSGGGPTINGHTCYGGSRTINVNSGGLVVMTPCAEYTWSGTGEMELIAQVLSVPGDLYSSLQEEKMHFAWNEGDNGRDLYAAFSGQPHTLEIVNPTSNGICISDVVLQNVVDNSGPRVIVDGEPFTVENPCEEGKVPCYLNSRVLLVSHILQEERGKEYVADEEVQNWEGTGITIEAMGDVSGDRKYLSTNNDGTAMDLWSAVGPEGRQQWSIVKGGSVESNPGSRRYETWYHIMVYGGVTGDNKYLSSNNDGSLVDLWTQDDGSGRQRWRIWQPESCNEPRCVRIRVFGGVEKRKNLLSASPDGTNVDLWYGDETMRQRWRLHADSNAASPTMELATLNDYCPGGQAPVATGWPMDVWAPVRGLNGAAGTQEHNSWLWLSGDSRACQLFYPNFVDYKPPWGLQSRNAYGKNAVCCVPGGTGGCQLETSVAGKSYDEWLAHCSTATTTTTFMPTTTTGMPTTPGGPSTGTAPPTTTPIPCRAGDKLFPVYDHHLTDNGWTLLGGIGRDQHTGNAEFGDHANACKDRKQWWGYGDPGSGAEFVAPFALTLRVTFGQCNQQDAATKANVIKAYVRRSGEATPGTLVSRVFGVGDSSANISPQEREITVFLHQGDVLFLEENHWSIMFIRRIETVSCGTNMTTVDTLMRNWTDPLTQQPIESCDSFLFYPSSASSLTSRGFQILNAPSYQDEVGMPQDSYEDGYNSCGSPSWWLREQTGTAPVTLRFGSRFDGSLYTGIGQCTNFGSIRGWGLFTVDTKAGTESTIATSSGVTASNYHFSVGIGYNFSTVMEYRATNWDLSDGTLLRAYLQNFNCYQAKCKPFPLHVPEFSHNYHGQNSSFYDRRFWADRIDWSQNGNLLNSLKALGHAGWESVQGMQDMKDDPATAGAECTAGRENQFVGGLLGGANSGAGGNALLRFRMNGRGIVRIVFGTCKSYGHIIALHMNWIWGQITKHAFEGSVTQNVDQELFFQMDNGQILELQVAHGAVLYLKSFEVDCSRTAIEPQYDTTGDYLRQHEQNCKNQTYAPSTLTSMQARGWRNVNLDTYDLFRMGNYGRVYDSYADCRHSPSFIGAASGTPWGQIEFKAPYFGTMRLRVGQCNGMYGSTAVTRSGPFVTGQDPGYSGFYNSGSNTLVPHPGVEVVVEFDANQVIVVEERLDYGIFTISSVNMTCRDPPRPPVCHNQTLHRPDWPQLHNLGAAMKESFSHGFNSTDPAVSNFRQQCQAVANWYAFSSTYANAPRRLQGKAGALSTSTGQGVARRTGARKTSDEEDEVDEEEGAVVENHAGVKVTKKQSPVVPQLSASLPVARRGLSAMGRLEMVMPAPAGVARIVFGNCGDYSSGTVRARLENPHQILGATFGRGWGQELFFAFQPWQIFILEDNDFGSEGVLFIQELTFVCEGPDNKHPLAVENFAFNYQSGKHNRSAHDVCDPVDFEPTTASMMRAYGWNLNGASTSDPMLSLDNNYAYTKSAWEECGNVYWFSSGDITFMFTGVGEMELTVGGCSQTGSHAQIQILLSGAPLYDNLPHRHQHRMHLQEFIGSQYQVDTVQRIRFNANQTVIIRESGGGRAYVKRVRIRCKAQRDLGGCESHANRSPPAAIGSPDANGVRLYDQTAASKWESMSAWHFGDGVEVIEVNLTTGEAPLPPEQNRTNGSTHSNGTNHTHQDGNHTNTDHNCWNGTLGNHTNHSNHTNGACGSSGQPRIYHAAQLQERLYMNKEFSRSQWTYEFWLNFTQSGGSRYEIFGCGSTDCNQEDGVYLVSGLQPQASCKNSYNGPSDPNKIFTDFTLHVGSSGTFSQTCLHTNVWYHFAITMDSMSDVRYYVNGQLDRTGHWSGGSTVANNKLHPGFGAGLVGGNGEIFNVRIWEVVRTEQQIRDHRYAMAPGEMDYTSGIVAWFPFHNNLDAPSGFTSMIYLNHPSMHPTYSSVSETVLRESDPPEPEPPMNFFQPAKTFYAADLRTTLELSKKFEPRNRPNGISGWTMEVWIYMRHSPGGAMQKDIYGANGATQGFFLADRITAGAASLPCTDIFGSDAHETERYLTNAAVHIGSSGVSSEHCLRRNTWYHLAATLTNEYKLSYYINGRPSGVNHTWSAGMEMNNMFETQLGNGFTSMDEYMMNFRIWDHARSLEEIKRDAFATHARNLRSNASGLVAWFPLQENLDTAIPRELLHGNNTTHRIGSMYLNPQPHVEYPVINSTVLENDTRMSIDEYGGGHSVYPEKGTLRCGGKLRNFVPFHSQEDFVHFSHTGGDAYTVDGGEPGNEDDHDHIYGGDRKYGIATSSTSAPPGDDPPAWTAARFVAHSPGNSSGLIELPLNGSHGGFVRFIYGNCYPEMLRPHDEEQQKVEAYLIHADGSGTLLDSVWQQNEDREITTKFDPGDSLALRDAQGSPYARAYLKAVQLSCPPGNMTTKDVEEKAASGYVHDVMEPNAILNFPPNPAGYSVSEEFYSKCEAIEYYPTSGSAMRSRGWDFTQLTNPMQIWQPYLSKDMKDFSSCNDTWFGKSDGSWNMNNQARLRMRGHGQLHITFGECYHDWQMNYNNGGGIALYLQGEDKWGKFREKDADPVTRARDFGQDTTVTLDFHPNQTLKIEAGATSVAYVKRLAIECFTEPTSTTTTTTTTITTTTNMRLAGLHFGMEIPPWIYRDINDRTDGRMVEEVTVPYEQNRDPASLSADELQFGSEYESIDVTSIFRGFCRRWHNDGQHADVHEGLENAYTTHKSHFPDEQFPFVNFNLEVRIADDSPTQDAIEFDAGLFRHESKYHDRTFRGDYGPLLRTAGPGPCEVYKGLVTERRDLANNIGACGGGEAVTKCTPQLSIGPSIPGPPQAAIAAGFNTSSKPPTLEESFGVGYTCDCGDYNLYPDETSKSLAKSFFKGWERIIDVKPRPFCAIKNPCLRGNAWNTWPEFEGSLNPCGSDVYSSTQRGSFFCSTYDPANGTYECDCSSDWNYVPALWDANETSISARVGKPTCKYVRPCEQGNPGGFFPWDAPHPPCGPPDFFNHCHNQHGQQYTCDCASGFISTTYSQAYQVNPLLRGRPVCADPGSKKACMKGPAADSCFDWEDGHWFDFWQPGMKVTLGPYVRMFRMDGATPDIRLPEWLLEVASYVKSKQDHESTAGSFGKEDMFSGVVEAVTPLAETQNLSPLEQVVRSNVAVRMDHFGILGWISGRMLRPYPFPVEREGAEVCLAAPDGASYDCACNDRYYDLLSATHVKADGTQGSVCRLKAQYRPPKAQQCSEVELNECEVFTDAASRKHTGNRCVRQASKFGHHETSHGTIYENSAFEHSCLCEAAGFELSGDGKRCVPRSDVESECSIACPSPNTCRATYFCVGNECRRRRECVCRTDGYSMGVYHERAPSETVYSTETGAELGRFRPGGVCRTDCGNRCFVTALVQNSLAHFVKQYGAQSEMLSIAGRDSSQNTFIQHADTFLSDCISRAQLSHRDGLSVKDQAFERVFEPHPHAFNKVAAHRDEVEIKRCCRTFEGIIGCGMNRCSGRGDTRPMEQIWQQSFPSLYQTRCIDDMLPASLRSTSGNPHAPAVLMAPWMLERKLVLSGSLFLEFDSLAEKQRFVSTYLDSNRVATASSQDSSVSNFVEVPLSAAHTSSTEPEFGQFDVQANLLEELRTVLRAKLIETVRNPNSAYGLGNMFPVDSSGINSVDVQELRVITSPNGVVGDSSIRLDTTSFGSRTSDYAAVAKAAAGLNATMHSMRSFAHSFAGRQNFAEFYDIGYKRYNEGVGGEHRIRIDFSIGPFRDADALTSVPQSSACHPNPVRGASEHETTYLYAHEDMVSGASAYGVIPDSIQADVTSGTSLSMRCSSVWDLFTDATVNIALEAARVRGFMTGTLPESAVPDVSGEPQISPIIGPSTKQGGSATSPDPGSSPGGSNLICNEGAGEPTRIQHGMAGDYSLLYETRDPKNMPHDHMPRIMQRAAITGGELDRVRFELQAGGSNEYQIFFESLEKMVLAVDGTGTLVVANEQMGATGAPPEQRWVVTDHPEYTDQSDCGMPVLVCIQNVGTASFLSWDTAMMPSYPHFSPSCDTMAKWETRRYHYDSEKACGPCKTVGGPPRQLLSPSDYYRLPQYRVTAHSAFYVSTQYDAPRGVALLHNETSVHFGPFLEISPPQTTTTTTPSPGENPLVTIMPDKFRAAEFAFAKFEFEAEEYEKICRSEEVLGRVLLADFANNWRTEWLGDAEIHIPNDFVVELELQLHAMRHIEDMHGHMREHHMPSAATVCVDVVEGLDSAGSVGFDKAAASLAPLLSGVERKPGVYGHLKDKNDKDGMGTGTIAGPMEKDKALCRSVQSGAGLRAIDISALFMRECTRRWRESDHDGATPALSSPTVLEIPFSDRHWMQQGSNDSPAFRNGLPSHIFPVSEDVGRKIEFAVRIGIPDEPSFPKVLLQFEAATQEYAGWVQPPLSPARSYVPPTTTTGPPISGEMCQTAPLLTLAHWGSSHFLVSENGASGLMRDGSAAAENPASSMQIQFQADPNNPTSHDYQITWPGYPNMALSVSDDGEAKLSLSAMTLPVPQSHQWRLTLHPDNSAKHPGCGGMTAQLCVTNLMTGMALLSDSGANVYLSGTGCIAGDQRSSWMVRHHADEQTNGCGECSFPTPQNTGTTTPAPFLECNTGGSEPIRVQHVTPGDYSLMSKEMMGAMGPSFEVQVMMRSMMSPPDGDKLRFELIPKTTYEYQLLFESMSNKVLAVEASPYNLAVQERDPNFGNPPPTQRWAVTDNPSYADHGDCGKPMWVCIKNLESNQFLAWEKGHSHPYLSGTCDGFGQWETRRYDHDADKACGGCRVTGKAAEASGSGPTTIVPGATTSSMPPTTGTMSTTNMYGTTSSMPPSATTSMYDGTTSAMPPTTMAPTTQVPTTQVPTTQVPTTQVPTTQVPTTQVPTTLTPTTTLPPPTGWICSTSDSWILIYASSSKQNNLAISNSGTEHHYLKARTAVWLKPKWRRWRLRKVSGQYNNYYVLKGYPDSGDYFNLRVRSTGNVDIKASSSTGTGISEEWWEITGHPNGGDYLCVRNVRRGRYLGDSDQKTGVSGTGEEAESFSSCTASKTRVLITDYEDKNENQCSPSRRELDEKENKDELDVEQKGGKKLVSAGGSAAPPPARREKRQLSGEGQIVSSNPTGDLSPSFVSSYGERSGNVLRSYSSFSSDRGPTSWTAAHVRPSAVRLRIAGVRAPRRHMQRQTNPTLRAYLEQHLSQGQRARLFATERSPASFRVAKMRNHVRHQATEVAGSQKSHDMFQVRYSEVDCINVRSLCTSPMSPATGVAPCVNAVNVTVSVTSDGSTEQQRISLSSDPSTGFLNPDHYCLLRENR
ncbi:unnamed protein product, partial [Amoebophrya sp. A25]|eukprot:GSA25T00000432001.1